MWRLLKILASTITVLIVLVVLAVVALTQVDVERYEDFVASTIEKRTGRKLTIDGEVRFKPSLSPTLVVEDVKFENADFAADPYMFTAKRLEGELELKPLLGGDIQIRSVKLIDPQLFLERGPGELRNWRFRKKRKRPNIPVLYIDKAEIQGGRVVYTNSATGFRYEYTGQSAYGWLREGTQIIEVVADGLLDGVPTHAEGTLGELEHLFLPEQASTIAVHANTADIDWGIKGTVQDALLARGVNFDVAANAASTTSIAVFTPFPIPDLGAVSATATLKGEPKAFTLGDIDGEVKGEDQSGSLRGWIEQLGKRNRMELNVSGKTESLVEFLAAFDRDWWLDGEATTRFVLQGVQKDYNLRDVIVNLESKDVNASLTGTVGTVSRLRDSDFDIEYEVNDISVFSDRLGTPLPAVGPAMGSARLRHADSVVTLGDIQAAIKNELLVANASGTIQDVGRLQGINVELGGVTTQPSLFADRLRFSLPEEGDLRFDAQLTRDDDAYRVERLSAGLSTAEFDIGVSGLVEDLRGLTGVDLEVSVLTDSLDKLSELSGQSLPPTDALQTFGRIYYEGGGSQRTHLDATIKGSDFDAAIAGAVDDITRFDGVEATVQLNADSLRQLSQIFKTDFPKLNNVKLAGTVRHNQADPVQTNNVDDEPAVVQARDPLTWVDGVLVSGNTRTKVQGSVDFTKTPKKWDVELNLNTNTLADLAPIIQSPWPGVGPVTGAARLLADGSSYAFDNVNVQVDGSDFQGNVAFVPGSGDTNPVITGVLESGVLDLRPFLPKKDDSVAGKKEKWFSERPFKFDFIRNSEFQIDLKAGELISRWSRLENLETRITTKNGQLQMPLTANLEPGNVDMTLEINVNKPVMPVTFKLLATDVDTEQISNIRDENIVQDGNIDLDILIDSDGRSLHELMAGANGHFLLTVNSGRISQTVLRLIGADILWQMARLLNPFGKRRNYLDLECGVFGFRIDDGVAHSNKWIATRSKEVAVVGAGVINLDSEDVEIALTPKAREGIGVSASSLVKLVRLGGTLSDLKAEADPAGLLKSGAYIGAAVASGGLSLLAQGLFDRVTANNRLCQKTLDNFDRGIVENGEQSESIKVPVTSRAVNNGRPSIQDRK